MKTALLIFAPSVLAFACGWFLKPPEAAPAAPVQSVAARIAAAAPVRDSNSLQNTPAQAAGRGSAGVEPLRSLDEVLTLLEDMLEDDDWEDLAALEMMEALPRFMVTDASSVRSMLAQMAAAPPKNAELRMMVAAALAGRWILQEPEAATGYILANPAVFGEKKSPEGTGAQIFDHDYVSHSLATLGAAMTARKNPGAAKAMLNLLPEDYGGELRKVLVLMEAKADPGKFLTSTPRETLDEMEDLTPILARWAKKDPQAAAGWVQNLDDADDDAWTAIAEGWADKDRAAATAWAMSLEDKDHRHAALSALASKAVEDLDTAAADAALAAFPPEVAVQALLERFDTADHTPAAGAAIVEDILNRYSDDDGIVSAAAGPAASVVQELVNGDDGEQQATAWLSRLPDSAAKSRAVEALIDQWAENDATAASAWIRALPESDVRQRATLQLINETKSDDPERAIEWARCISSEDMRREQVKSILRDWLPKDPYKAMTALQQFPQEDQTAMFSEQQH